MPSSREAARTGGHTSESPRFVYRLVAATLLGLMLGGGLWLLVTSSTQVRLLLLVAMPLAVTTGWALSRSFPRRQPAADESVRQQRNILQSVLDSLADGVAVADRHGNLKLFNPEAIRILGRVESESSAEEWPAIYGLFHPDMKTQFATEDLPLVRALRGETTHDTEIFVRNPNVPQGVFICVNAAPLRDHAGEPQGGVAVFRDVSDSKKAWAAVHESEARFRQLAESIPQVFWISDSAVQKANYVSPAYERIWGRSVKALYENPMDWLEAVHQDDRQRVLETLERTKAEAYQITFRIVRPDGEIRWIRDSGFPVHDELNRFARMTGIAEDITDERGAEEDRRLRDLAAHLQDARENERLYLAREIHDELGQGLTGLKLEVSYVQKKLRTDPGGSHAGMEHLAVQIDEIIRSVRRISGKLRPVLLDEVGIYDAIRWHTRQFQKRSGVECSLRLPSREPGWDRDRSTALFRILQESLTNVARHAGATRVEVHVQRTDDCVLLEVRDDGRGIREEEITGTRSFGLMGMHERARMFGGELVVAPRSGAGTRVSVRMPC